MWYSSNARALLCCNFSLIFFLLLVMFHVHIPVRNPTSSTSYKTSSITEKITRLHLLTVYRDYLYSDDYVLT